VSREITEEEREHKAFLAAMRDEFKRPGMRDLLWHVLSMCNVWGGTFTGNSQTFYLEGKRQVGIELLQLIEEVDPTLFPRMMLEKQKTVED
jgi:hypothetical protein